MWGATTTKEGIAYFDELVALLETHAGREVWPSALPLFRDAYIEAPEGFERELRDVIADRGANRPVNLLRWRVKQGKHRALSSSSPTARRSRRASDSRGAGPRRLELVVRAMDDCLKCGERFELVEVDDAYCVTCASEVGA